MAQVMAAPQSQPMGNGGWAYQWMTLGPQRAATTAPLMAPRRAKRRMSMRSLPCYSSLRVRKVAALAWAAASFSCAHARPPETPAPGRPVAVIFAERSSLATALEVALQEGGVEVRWGGAPTGFANSFAVGIGTAGCREARQAGGKGLVLVQPESESDVPALPTLLLEGERVPRRPLIPPSAELRFEALDRGLDLLRPTNCTP